MQNYQQKIETLAIFKQSDNFKLRKTKWQSAIL